MDISQYKYILYEYPHFFKVIKGQDGCYSYAHGIGNKKVPQMLRIRGPNKDNGFESISLCTSNQNIFIVSGRISLVSCSTGVPCLGGGPPLFTSFSAYHAVNQA